MHRVMNEKMKCFNIHGHTYLYELEFEFNQMEEIGYAIDFKEIKRIGCQWIDDILDHGAIINHHDSKVFGAINSTGSKYWAMSLNGKDFYCNPTVENIAKEIFLAMEILFIPYRENLRIHKITLYETPNCFTVCTKESISAYERSNFDDKNLISIKKYAEGKGQIVYDDRKEKIETKAKSILEILSIAGLTAEDAALALKDAMKGEQY